jgi:hypothetical protein
MIYNLTVNDHLGYTDKKKLENNIKIEHKKKVRVYIN